MVHTTRSEPMKVGPQLPPHILAAREAKRKRLADTVAADARKVQESNLETKAAQSVTLSGDSIEDNADQSNRKDNDSPDADAPVKKTRTIGPSMGPFVGPARSDTRESPDRRDGSEPRSHLKRFDDEPVRNTRAEENASRSSGSVRDEWMTLPPTKSDWAAKQTDPLQLRPRKFLTGSSASRAGQGADQSWMETEAERKKRVAEEMMGLRKKQEDQPTIELSRPTERDEELAQQVKEYNERNRGKSLMEQYQAVVGSNSGGEGKKPDDPSKRGFDYEKDIASGGRTMDSSRIQEFVKRASSMDSKFSKGRYL
ncbi:uncharacterized protein V1513DRAFT_482123 [Lipomyces chichibuensis]|uniref:uncharacterized protein n=1 Tax=Lipomyces chichibuensis TaxID=1546026 RepID=UPI003342F08C